MKGDFTRDTFRPERHYSGVRMQQGRVQLDADWNEQADIRTHLRQAADRDLIGLRGGPKGRDAGGHDLAGFKVEAAGKDLRITRGRYYVDGVLCQNETDVLITQQPDLEEVKGVTKSPLPSVAGDYLIYLEVWDRHVTAVEDPEIREKALGGADTATRTRTTWQVRFYQAGQHPDCGSFGPGWTPDPEPPGGRLAARAEKASGGDGAPCVSPTAGYRRVENQLYRVEIHQGGQAGGAATFKWSRDNGTVVAPWKSASGNDLEIDDSDRSLSFADDDWVELTDDTRELWGLPGVFVQLKEVEGQTLTLDPNTLADPNDPSATTVDFTKFPRHPKVRRWESEGAVKVEVPADNDGWIPLEDGVEVRFESGKTYNTGDYWLIPARTVLGDVLWPTVGDPPFVRRHGVDRRYCPLALVGLDAGGQFRVIADCRRLFPPATAITAEDVGFKDGVCELGAGTVQEAIDALCRSRKDGCSLVVLPGTGWEKTLDRIADGQDAHVCFQVGTYTLDGGYTFKDKGHLEITGCGPGTRIVAPKAEAALRFEKCASVTVRDLHAESGALGAKTAGKKGLNGTLTFCACPRVDVDNVSLKCAAGNRRHATCITVIDTCDPPRKGTRTVVPVTAHVRRSRLAIGHLQVGILIVNAARARVEDNELKVAKKPKSLSFARQVEDKTLRARVRETLIRNPSLEETRRASGDNVVTLSYGGRTVSFKTEKSLVPEWSHVLEARPPGVFLNSNRDLWLHVKGIADQVILNQGRIGQVAVFRPWYVRISEENPAVASQAIVVGGRVASDVRIRDNTISGALQGIHLGVSHRETRPGTADRAGTVLITGNQVEVLLPVIQRERFGIFVGNCDSLVIENNTLKLRRLAGAERWVEGIRVYGHLGKRMIVRQNHLEGFNLGIDVEVLNPDAFRQPQWLVADNVASLLAPAKVRKSNNFA